MNNLISTTTPGTEKHTTIPSQIDTSITSENLIAKNNKPTELPGNTSWTIEIWIRSKPWFPVLCAFVAFFLFAIVLVCITVRCIRKRKLAITSRSRNHLEVDKTQLGHFSNNSYAHMNGDGVYLSCEEYGSMRRQPERVLYRRGTYGRKWHAYRSTIKGQKHQEPITERPLDVATYL